ncbi:zinc finger protein AEBP2 [Cladorrhinum sp. PSN259]|nr:zinc finger protein AEBP2 [Cladorrhinum sp. PSN259]
MAGYHTSYEYYQQQSPVYDGLPYQQDSCSNWPGSPSMQRTRSTHSQTTTYTVDSNDTAGTQSSAYYTDVSSADLESPIMEGASHEDSAIDWYQESSYPEPQDASQLVMATGSQYYTDTTMDSQNSPGVPEELQFPSAQQAFDGLIPDIEEAAKQATRTVMAQATIGQMASYEATWVINSKVIDSHLGWNQGQDQNSACREAVQGLLINHFHQLFHTNPSYDEVNKVLLQAAYQLLTRLQGQEISQICYLAITAALAQLRQQLDDGSGATASTAAVASSGSSTSHAENQSYHYEKQFYPCRFPNCHAKSFSRSADLERHYNMVHVDETKKRKFACDYKRCSRHEVPFFRQDHFRDHLRSYHKEDLPRRSKKPDAAWWQGRSKYAMESGWWRCNRCLVVRVNIEQDGFTCPKCGASCEVDRQRLRLGLPQERGSRSPVDRL